MVVSMAACGAKEEAAAPAATEAAKEEAASEAEVEAASNPLYAITGPSKVFEFPWFNMGPQTWVKVMYETLIGMDAKGAATTSCGMAESYTFDSQKSYDL